MEEQSLTLIRSSMFISVHPWFLAHLQRDDGSAPATDFGRRVGEVCDERCASKNLADDLALDADAFAVNDAHAPTAARVGFVEIIFDDGAYLPGWNRMQVEHVAEGNDHH